MAWNDSRNSTTKWAPQPKPGEHCTNRSTRSAKLQCFAGHKQMHAHSASLVGYVEQAGWYRDATQQAAAAKGRAEDTRAKLDRSIESLGSDWNHERLESLDTGLVLAVG